uniref:Putative serine/threonine protein kinase n=1 Tax=Pithovirus LCPAC101 TaxID=2506586 RepID=A0A481Z3H6_9VIRU|nr:MAG: putative serine/threonine protein kinase [Pithovirus LCPAC101]
MDNCDASTNINLSSLINGYTVFGEAEGFYSKILYLSSNVDKKKVAYKIFGPNMSHNSRCKEIRLHNIIEHDNIIKAYHVDAYGILMEYGVCMTYLNYKTMADIYITISQISMALEYLHINNYIYFDLKAENIVLVRDEYNDNKSLIKLIDIGSCIHENNIYIDKEKNEFRRDSGIVYSKLYSSPEIIINKYKLSVQHDMWSLGVILSELAYNYHPYLNIDMKSIDELRSSASADALYRIIIDNYRNETSIFPNNIINNNSHYSKLIDDFDTKPSEIIAKLVEYDPSKRLTSAQLLDLLYNLLSK